MSTEPKPQNEHLVQLELQAERGNMFTHSALGENAQRLSEVEAFLHGLIDVLLTKELIHETELASAIQKVRSELLQRDPAGAAKVMIRLENPANPEMPVEVDCRARMHICHAVCCKLDFALTIPELESGKVKWDFGRPYFIQHDQHGSCVHLDANSGCRIYKDRPGVCSRYTCATDKRIWKDFEKMELNEEWIEANLSQPQGARLIHALMHHPNDLATPGGADSSRRPVSNDADSLE